MGALTSKPYAFHGRPWELKSIASYDILDTNCAPIWLDLRGSQVMRILPRISGNYEWITDKIRFSYDSFQLQRLATPLIHIPTKTINNITNMFQTANWLQTLQFLSNQSINNLTLYEFIGGKFMDIKSINTIKQFQETTKTSIITFDHLNEVMENPITLVVNPVALKTANSVILINTNLRFENPILFQAIRQQHLKNYKDVYILGPTNSVNFPTINLGTNVSLVKFLNGFHPVWKKWSKLTKQRVVALVGQHATNATHPIVSKLINHIATSFSFNLGLQFLISLITTSITTTNAQIYGFNTRINNFNVNKFIFLHEAEGIKDQFEIEDTCVAFSGHRSEKLINRNVIMPTQMLFEQKAFSTINNLGTVNSSSMVFSASFNVKSLTEILTNYLKFLFPRHNGKSTIELNIKELIKGHIMYFPFLTNNENVISSLKPINSLSMHGIFQSDIIARASKNLSLAGLRFELNSNKIFN